MTTVFLALVTALTVLTVTASACSDDGGNDDARQDDTTSTTVDEEAAVLAAYEAGWRAFEEASANPVDPDHPALAETMTGQALAAATRSLGQMAEMSEYLDGPQVEHTARVVELSARRAVVEDCLVDRTTRYAANGTVVGESDPSPVTYEGVMVKEGGVWKNAELTEGETCQP